MYDTCNLEMEFLEIEGGTFYVRANIYLPVCHLTWRQDIKAMKTRYNSRKYNYNVVFIDTSEIWNYGQNFVSHRLGQWAMESRILLIN